MGVSLHVVGFKVADTKWHQMLDVYNSCLAARVDIPRKVQDYFKDCNDPNEASGMQVDIEDTPAVQSWSGDDAGGFEIDLTQLPQDVKRIRAYLS